MQIEGLIPFKSYTNQAMNFFIFSENSNQFLLFFYCQVNFYDYRLCYFNS